MSNCGFAYGELGGQGLGFTCVYTHVHMGVCFNAGSDSMYRASLGVGGQEGLSWARGAALHRGLLLKRLGASGVCLSQTPLPVFVKVTDAASLASLRRIKSVNAT